MKGVLRKCRKYYLDTFLYFAQKRPNDVIKDDLDRFCKERFSTYPRQEGLYIYLAIFIFSTDLQKGTLSHLLPKSEGEVGI